MYRETAHGRKTNESADSGKLVNVREWGIRWRDWNSWRDAPQELRRFNAAKIAISGCSSPHHHFGFGHKAANLLIKRTIRRLHDFPQTLECGLGLHLLANLLRGICRPGFALGFAGKRGVS
jgi:hypothetical protein